jgi:nucleoside 2-deoxyribosyltransferase
MKIYLAGKYADRVKLGVKRDELRCLGHSITHDWMTYESSGPNTPEKLGEFAKFDIDGVMQSDVVVQVLDDPEYAYRGTFTELGAAIASNKYIVMVLPAGEMKCKENVFCYHPAIHHVETWEGAKTILQRLTHDGTYATH